MQRTWRILGILAFTQILSWGALYYAFSILAPFIGQTLGMRAEIVYGAFSWSLLVAGWSPLQQACCWTVSVASGSWRPARWSAAWD